MQRLLGLVLLGAAACSPQPITTVSFDREEAAFALGEGTNRIDGRVEVRESAMRGYICFRQRVVLVPAIPWTREYAEAKYGVSDRQAMATRLKSGSSPEGVGDFVRVTQCDDNGAFSFENVPDGPYFIEAMILFGDRQSNDVMAPIVLEGGGTTEVLISPELRN